MKRAALLLVVCLAGCGDEAPKPYLKVLTGGLSFDPAHTHATAKLVAKQISPLPPGGKLVARFSMKDREARLVSLPVTAGQLTYQFEIDEPVGDRPIEKVRITLSAFDASGKEVDVLEASYGGPMDKHDIPRNSDMIPNRERQVEQLNDEGF
jgi:trans-aconitate methyltransferase